MADPHHVEMLDRSNDDWNAWRLQWGGDARVIDLSGADLRGRRLGGFVFNDVDLSGANLTGAVLTSSLFRNASLVGANLTDADMTRCIIDNANFSRANCTRTKFAYVWARGAVFTDAVFQDVDFRVTYFSPAELAGAKIVVSPPSQDWLDTAGLEAWNPGQKWFDLLEVDLAARVLKFHEGVVQITDDTAFMGLRVRKGERAPLNGLGDLKVGRRYLITYLGENGCAVAQRVLGPQEE